MFEAVPSKTYLSAAAVKFAFAVVIHDAAVVVAVEGSFTAATQTITFLPLLPRRFVAHPPSVETLLSELAMKEVMKEVIGGNDCRPRPNRGPRRPPSVHEPRRKRRQKVRIDAKLRSYILKWHNKHRLQLAKGQLRGQPKAANMKLLRWEEEIAVKSQAWAEKCDYTHEANKHCKTAGFHSLGENIAVSTINYPGTMTTDRDLLGMVRHALESMWKEHSHFTFGKSPGKCSREPCGHYTQMVWAETEAIGCGLTACFDIKHWNPGKDRNTLFLVCKYGPAGNINGIFPYNSGQPCSQCGAKEPKCRSGGLCSRDPTQKTSCVDSSQSCEAMKARGSRGRYTCWPCAKWLREGTCDVCANTFRHAREVCAKTCGLCRYDYTLNNKS